MDSFIFVLGRQPELSLAELESVFGSENIKQASRTIAVGKLSSWPANYQPEFLGGTIKIAKVIGSSIRDIHQILPESGKITMGISVYDKKLNANKIATEIKQSLSKRNGSVRIVPNPTGELSSATVLHNKLYKGGNKFEFIFAHDGSKTILAQTTYVQNIEDYTFRDRSRPKRDARVGMLPPKLAQIMLNLALNDKLPPFTVLDPFCGTGVVLQEAALMGRELIKTGMPGITVYGSDINEKMVGYTNENLSWLAEKYHFSFDGTIEVGDATSHAWTKPFNFVVCETYLGQPYSIAPSPDKLRENIETCNTIIKKFLKNLHGQANISVKACIAVPVWFVRGKTHHLPVVKELGSLGYKTQIKPLIYARDDQIVGRELLVLAKS